MSAYRLRFLDPSGKFIRADRIESGCDREAVAEAYDRRLRVRSELWLGSRLVAKLPPAGHRATRERQYPSTAHHLSVELSHGG